METKEVPFAKVRPGEVVRLLTTASDGRGHQYQNRYAKKDEVGLVTALDSYDGYTYLLVETLAAEGLVTRYVDNSKAKFSVLYAGEKEAWLAERAAMVKDRPLFAGTGNGRIVGSDPEVFVVDATDTVIPAWTFLGDKNDAARRHADGAEYYGAFWDGFQAEFTVLAGTCHEETVSAIRQGMLKVLRAAWVKFPDARLTPRAVLNVPAKMMDETSDLHAALGCAPSLNAYKGVKPLNIRDGRSLPFRFAGCHYHLGYKDLQPDRAKRIVKAMDAIYGVISVAMFRELEDPRRRQFYGRAGEHRLPKHGLEYRVPSSMVLCDPIVTHLNFDLMRASALIGDRLLTNQWVVPGGEKQVQHIINNYDVDGALAVIKTNFPRFQEILRSIYPAGGNYQQKSAAFAEQIIMEGVEEVIRVDDMRANWSLGEPAETDRAITDHWYSNVGRYGVRGLGRRR